MLDCDSFSCVDLFWFLQVNVAIILLASAAAVVLLPSCAEAATFTDTDILNFALNLEVGSTTKDRSMITVAEIERSLLVSNSAVPGS